MNQQATLSQKLAMASRHQASGNYREAASLYRQVLTIDPGNVAANFAIATRLLKVRRDGRARQFLEKVVEREPGHFEARLRLMEIAFDHGEKEKQSALLEELLASTTDNRLLILLADAMRGMAMSAPAAEVYLRCLAIDPGQYGVHCSLGTLYRDQGKLDLAERHLRDAIAIDPARVEAYSLLSRMDRIDDGSAEAEALGRMQLARQDLDDRSRILLDYALGRLRRRGGDTAGAFGHYLQANRELARLQSYSAEKNRERCRGIQAAFSKEFFLETPLVSSDSSCPIFIVGMPRSGTGLVERILSRHPQVFGAGALDDFGAFAHRLEAILSKPFYEEARNYNPTLFRRLARRYLAKTSAVSGAAQRVTDRGAQNFLYIGLIRLVFPHARIVHCRRNPLDNCLSIFTNVSTRAQPYAHELSNLGRYYGDYARLMRHWHDALPFRIYDVQYEELVTGSEEEVRALLNFCGLPFDPACLDVGASGGPAGGPGAGDIRRPVSRESGWAHSAGEVASLVETLREEGVLDKGVPNQGVPDREESGGHVSRN